MTRGSVMGFVSRPTARGAGVWGAVPTRGEFSNSVTNERIGPYRS